MIDESKNYNTAFLSDLALSMHQGINTVADKVNYENKGFPIIQSKNITKGFLDLENVRYVSEADHNKYCVKYNPNKNDVLVCNIGTIGKSFLVKQDDSFLIAWNLFLIKLNQKIINSNYFINYLNFLVARNYFDRFLTGGTVKFINKKTMGNIQIPLPPLKEQKRIAAILDEADKIRKLNKKLIEHYEQLSQSLFLEMFGDPVSNPMGWDFETIENLVVEGRRALKRGPFGGALKKEIFVEKGYLVYEQYHALNNDFTFERYYIDENKFQELKAFEVKPNDIIVSCSGVYLGKLAIVPVNAKKGIINQALLKITLNEDKMRNGFFTFLFTQKSFKEKYFDSNRGAGIPNFPPMSEFKKFLFINPPISLQNQFSDRLQEIEKQKEKAEQSLKKAEELFQSLLQRAFKGKL